MVDLLFRGLAAAVLLLGSAGPIPTSAQTQPASADRHSRFAVVEDSAFSRAVRQGTRTRTGDPGPTYWQQFAEYDIEARFVPDTNRLVGQQRVVYHNRSPDTLRQVAVHLRHNHFQDESGTDGVVLNRVAVAGTPLSPHGSPGYRVDGTVAWLDLPTALPPQDRIALSFAWRQRVPRAPADGRQGRDGPVAFFGFWYPQLAVYDDIEGWVAEPYTGQAEFYMGRADYDVRLTVPGGWLVGATGRLQNPADVLSARSRRRLVRARRTGAVVALQGPDERDQGRALRTSETPTTWHFRAQNVRDFAWGTSARYVWDATRALVSGASPQSSVDTSTDGDPPPDTVMVHSLYRPTEAASAWPQAARHTREAVETLSTTLPPYPSPTMTAMEGVLRSGGMEYPMCTIMRPWADSLKLAGDLTHEVAHNWLPMAVGPNEKRYVWMDEGLTQYNTAWAMRRRYGPGPRPQGRPNDSETGQRQTYLQIAQQGYEVPLMTHGDEMPRGLYFHLPYDKAAQVLSMLREVLGTNTFRQAYRAFITRWWGKHPSPYDFFNTIADVSGRDLSWFWHTWFYTTATLDQALTDVHTTEDSTTITIANKGRAPMPVRLVVTRADGSTGRRTVPVDVWLDDANTHQIRVPAHPPLVRVEIDPEAAFPDVDRSNQVWRRGQ